MKSIQEVLLSMIANQIKEKEKDIERFKAIAAELSKAHLELKKDNDEANKEWES